MVAFVFTAALAFPVESSQNDTLCRCRGNVEKKTVLENLDLVLLAMDETVDGGCAMLYTGACIVVHQPLGGRQWLCPSFCL